MLESEWLTSQNPQAMLDYLRIVKYDDPPQPDDGAKASDRKLRLFAHACWLKSSDSSLSPRWFEALKQLEELAEGVRAAFDRNVLGFVCATASVPDLLRQLSGLWVGQNTAADERDRNAFMAANFLREIVGNPRRPVTLCGMERKPFHNQHAHVDKNGGFWLEAECPACAQFRTPTVLAIAGDIYDRRAFEEMPVLSDALEEAGLADSYEEIDVRVSGYNHQWRVFRVTGEAVYPILHEARTFMDAVRWADRELRAKLWKTRVSDGTSTSPICWGRGKLRVPNPILEHLRSPGPHCRGCHVLDMLTGRE
jgi:hypothetical protein